jgi:hypothetical protein
MEERATDMRLVSRSGDGSTTSDEAPDRLGLSAADLDAARELAEFHRMLAADLPPQSQLRGLLLRCGGHWSRLGAIPRNGLAKVDGVEGD